MNQRDLPAFEVQERFWNERNAKNGEVVVGPVSQRQAAKILGRIAAIGRSDLVILDVGLWQRMDVREAASFRRRDRHRSRR